MFFQVNDGTWTTNPPTIGPVSFSNEQKGNVPVSSLACAVHFEIKKLGPDSAHRDLLQASLLALSAQFRGRFFSVPELCVCLLRVLKLDMNDVIVRTLFDTENRLFKFYLFNFLFNLACIRRCMAFWMAANGTAVVVVVDSDSDGETGLTPIKIDGSEKEGWVHILSSKGYPSER